MVPGTYTKVPDEDTKIKLQRLFDMLEDHDDVQNVWHNCD